MDMELEFDYDEREKDTMILEIDGLQLTIPEEILEEREYYFDFKTREENIEDIKKDHTIFLDCFLTYESKNLDKYNERFISHLESELALFR